LTIAFVLFLVSYTTASWRRGQSLRRWSLAGGLSLIYAWNIRGGPKKV